MYDSYTIPQEIKSEVYLGKGFYLLDLGIIIGYWFVMSNFDSLIYDTLGLAYTIFNVVVAFLLTRKSTAHPQKRIYETLLMYVLSFKATAYHVRERRNHAEIELN